MSEEIKAITMPGVHQKFLGYFSKNPLPEGAAVLDIGAGHGAFSKRLFDQGYNVSACDLFPELFHFSEIPCEKVDITEPFPYPDHSFDGVVGIEVLEHILDHENFFRECDRILKPGGKLYLSTPNILSLKSRVRFLFRGFYYSFGPLEMDNHDGLQHICSRSLNQYNYIARKYGLGDAHVEVDREQNSSKWQYIVMKPLIWANSKIKKASNIHNKRKLLLGRVLFLTYFKPN